MSVCEYPQPSASGGCGLPALPQQGRFAPWEVMDDKMARRGHKIRLKSLSLQPPVGRGYVRQNTVSIMFGFRGVFNRKPRQFEYRPRYYDPEQERREQRKKELLGADYRERYKSDEERQANYVPGKYVRESMIVRRGIGSSAKIGSAARMRLVIVLILLGLAVWWLFGTDSITNFFAKWLGR